MSSPVVICVRGTGLWLHGLTLGGLLLCGHEEQRSRHQPEVLREQAPFHPTRKLTTRPPALAPLPQATAPWGPLDNSGAHTCSLRTGAMTVHMS